MHHLEQHLNAHQYSVFGLQRGETALHMAARAGQMEVVRCLLRNGALVDAMARVSQLSPSQLITISFCLSWINTFNLSTCIQLLLGHVTSSALASVHLISYLSLLIFLISNVPQISLFFSFLGHRKIRPPFTLHHVWEKLILSSCCCSTWLIQMPPPPMATLPSTFQQERARSRLLPCCWRPELHIHWPQRWAKAGT